VAKADDTGTLRFLEEMDRKLVGWANPAARLRQALERDELQLFSQPILALREPRQFEMAEALVRLREEETLLLPPGDFLPVFEHHGMMADLDRWVVTHIVRLLAGGATGGFRRFSINVSAQSLGDASVPAHVGAELRSLGVPPDALGFEIDELDVLQQPQEAARFAAAVKRLGCRVLIDGFGQRSVSFAPLRTLRADYVKVDGSIVRNIGRSEIARAKLAAVVRVGGVIGVGVIGECVEETDILAMLQTMGVGFAQGFGIARPGPIRP